MRGVVCAFITLMMVGSTVQAQTGTEEEDVMPMAAPAPDDPAAGDDGAGDDAAGGGGGMDDGGGLNADTANDTPPPVEEEEEVDEEDGDSGAAADAATETRLLGDEQSDARHELESADTRSSTDPYEDPTRQYYFLGFFYNHHFTSQFIIDLFTDEATGANNPALGLEFTYRKDGFDIITRAWYQSFFVEGAFRGPGDTEFETEIIDSNLKAIMASATFLWGTDFNDIVSLQYGIGLGFGVVFGDMFRDEAFPNDGSDGRDVYQGYSRCDSVGTPGASVTGSDQYCDLTAVGDGMMGGHFGVKARRWTDGGSVPVVWFRASIPHLALRIKPIKQLVIRLEGGFDIFSGFFTGGSISVGFGGNPPTSADAD